MGHWIHHKTSREDEFSNVCNLCPITVSWSAVATGHLELRVVGGTRGAEAGCGLSAGRPASGRVSRPGCHLRALPACHCVRFSVYSHPCEAVVLQYWIPTLGTVGFTGEELVTKESFVSVCWRLVPYWSVSRSPDQCTIPAKLEFGRLAPCPPCLHLSHPPFA